MKRKIIEPATEFSMMSYTYQHCEMMIVLGCKTYHVLLMYRFKQLPNAVKGQLTVTCNYHAWKTNPSEESYKTMQFYPKCSIRKRITYDI